MFLGVVYSTFNATSYRYFLNSFLYTLAHTKTSRYYLTNNSVSQAFIYFTFFKILYSTFCGTLTDKAINNYTYGPF